MADLGVEIAWLALLFKDSKERIKRRHEVSKGRLKMILNHLRRRKRRGTLLLRLNEINRRREIVERRFWREPSRGQCLFWERTVSMWTDEKLWIENFRMSKPSFSLICAELREALIKKDTGFRKAITVEKRVAVCLWHLATGEDMRSLSWRFDIGKSTACEIVNEVCQAIVDVLLPSVIRWPTGVELESVLNGFAKEWNFPQCGGAIDGTHIPITAPPEYSANYFNRKSFYSIIMQVVVDHAYR